MDTKYAQAAGRLSKEFLSNLGTRLRELRERAGIDPVQIRTATGFSRSGINKMEGPQSNPEIRSLNAYLLTCNQTLGEFFEDTIPSGINGTDRKYVRLITKGLEDPKYRKLIISLADVIRGHQ